jgi:hypothetical protein
MHWLPKPARRVRFPSPAPTRQGQQNRVFLELEAVVRLRINASLAVLFLCLMLADGINYCALAVHHFHGGGE